MRSAWLREVRRSDSHSGDDGRSAARTALPSPPTSFVDADERAIRIRAADGDRDALVELYAAFEGTRRTQGLPPVGEPAVREWLDAVVDERSVLAWHDDQVVGHVMFVSAGTEPPELAIFVHPAYQRAGIGSTLIRAGLGHARDHAVERVWLSVERRNRGAVRLYRRVGFETTDPGGSALRMARQL